MVIGIVAEYNPFHKGHLYQINKIRDKYQDSTIIALVSGGFTQRGEVSILSKFDKTRICLQYGVDLVVLFPFVFASQAADIFARGALEILNKLHIDLLAFGYDELEENTLNKMAKMQLSDNNYRAQVKMYLDQGINYPTALAKALDDKLKIKISKPNDLLALAYIREIIKNNYPFKPFLIKRTNDYHGKDVSDDNIVSASLIRRLYKEGQDISNFIPKYEVNVFNRINDDKYFTLLKYQIINNIDQLGLFNSVTEGIDNKIRSEISKVDNLDDLIRALKSKRYTYNRIRRMLTHILCNFKKTDNIWEIKYIKVLGFRERGKKHLNHFKKDIPILPKNNDDLIYETERRVDLLYTLLIDNDKKDEYIELLKRNKPIF